MIRNITVRFPWLRFVFPLSIGLLLCLWLTGAASVGKADAGNAVQDEILVGMNPSGWAASVNARVLGPGTVTQALDRIHAHRIKLPKGMTLSQGLTLYRGMPGVAYAEANHVRKVVATPNDSGYANQYGPWRMQADKAWDLWQPNGQTVIAIVDTGVDNAHPDLTNKILRDSAGIVGWNAGAIDPATGLPKTRDDALDDYGHGTHCAGIAAAQTNNSQGIAGIAGWDGNAAHTDTSVKIMPVKVLQNGSGSDADVASGITWAADHGARVISMSLGGPDYSDTLNNACQYAWQKGCVIVAAAGNDGSSALFYPAANPNVVSVAATDSSDVLAGFSNWGSWVQVAAPGVSVYSTLPTYSTGFGSGYGSLSGTSMACPHVAGEAALLRSFRPQLTNVQTVNLIKANVDPYTPSGTNAINANGGRVNAYRAIQAAANLVVPDVPTGVTATAGNTQVTVAWTAANGATSYNLYRATTAGGEGATPVKTGITTTSYVDTGLTNGTTYFYKVSAANAIGESGLSSEASATPSGGGSSTLYQINCGGSSVGSFSADNFFVGGIAWSTTHPMDTSGATNPAPPSAYQTVRYDPSQFSYVFPGLSAGTSYKVRLHMVEPVSTALGTRPMNIDINAERVLSSFDPALAAGGSFKAVIPEFTVPADSNGKISITFTRLNGDVPCVAAIEVLGSTPQAPGTPTGVTATAGNAQVTVGWNAVSGATSYNLYRSTSAGGEGSTPVKTGLTTANYTDTGLTNGATYYYKVSAVNAVGESAQSVEVNATPSGGGGGGNAIYQINCGGGAIGSFAADNFFVGGVAWSTSQTMDTSGATNPAPASAYQTVRYDPSQFSYVFPGLTVGSSYKVRLHMVEPVSGSLGTRPMNININGVRALTGFDPAIAAGGSFRAVIPEFSVPADINGKISITFIRTNGDVPCVAAIEILSDTPQAPGTPTGVAATAGNAQVALTWNSASGATSYNLYRATSAGGEGATPYKTGITSASYTDTGLTNGTTYYYKVSAVNSVGESAPSAEVSAAPSGGGSGTVVYRINCGGAALGSFAADSFFSGGIAWSTTAQMDTSGATNPAPAAAYQTVRYDPSQFSYTFPNLTAGTAYKVRLHMIEPVSSSLGTRPMNIDINGTRVLTNFDPAIAAGGGFRAVIPEFTVPADSTGKIKITFIRTNGDVPCVAAIEILN